VKRLVMQLPEHITLALQSVKAQVERKYPVRQVILFGSQARQEGDCESDYDILLLTKKRLSHREKHEIYAITTNANLRFETNISVLVIDEKSWNEGAFSVLPIAEEIKRDGIIVG